MLLSSSVSGIRQLRASFFDFEMNASWFYPEHVFVIP